jgi:signal peptidase II
MRHSPPPPSPAPPSRLLRAALLVSLVVGVFGCDHATKMAAKANLDGAPPVNLVQLRYTENPDVAFSLLERFHIPHSPFLLAGVAIAALLFAGVLLFRSGITKGSRLAQVGLAIALAGGLGNIVDRVLRGAVVDFIHVKGWPVFNVADIAVVVGMLLVGFARNTRPRTPSTPTSGTPSTAERESMS